MCYSPSYIRQFVGIHSRGGGSNICQELPNSFYNRLSLFTQSFHWVYTRDCLAFKTVLRFSQNMSQAGKYVDVWPPSSLVHPLSSGLHIFLSFIFFHLFCNLFLSLVTERFIDCHGLGMNGMKIFERQKYHCKWETDKSTSKLHD